MKNSCIETYPLSILCTLVDIDEIDIINQFLQCTMPKSTKNRGCWYPFGNRKEILKKTCDYLCSENLLKAGETDSFNYYICNTKSKLKFYVHKSRNQNGSATINKVLLIDKIVISKKNKIPIKNKIENAIPSKEYSDVWLYITKVEEIATIDASIFLIHHLHNEQKFAHFYCHYDHKRHGSKLYKNVIPVFLDEGNKTSPNTVSNAVPYGYQISQCLGPYGKR